MPTLAVLISANSPLPWVGQQVFISQVALDDKFWDLGAKLRRLIFLINSHWLHNIAKFESFPNVLPFWIVRFFRFLWLIILWRFHYLEKTIRPCDWLYLFLNKLSLKFFAHGWDNGIRLLLLAMNAINDPIDNFWRHSFISSQVQTLKSLSLIQEGS